MILSQMVGKVFRNGTFIIYVPIEAIFQTNTIDFHVQLKCTNTTCWLLLWVSITCYSFTNSLSNLSLKVNQRRIFCDYQVSKFLWCEIGVIDIPTKLLFISFSLQFQIKMNRYKYLFNISRTLFRNISDRRCQYELLIYCFVKSCVTRAARIQTVKPLCKCILNFNVMPFDFTLQPKRQGGVMDTCFSGDIDLFDVVFGQGLQHLSTYIFFDSFSHSIIGFNLLSQSQQTFAGCLFVLQGFIIDLILIHQMQRRKQNLKKTCPHKQQKLSLDSRVKPLKKDISTYKSPEKLTSGRLEAKVLLENQQLREQNYFYQQYFATFEKRYKEQKRENKQLKRQIHELGKELSKEKENYSLNKRCQTAFSTSEKTIANKLSRATKCSGGTFCYE